VSGEQFVLDEVKWPRLKDQFRGVAAIASLAATYVLTANYTSRQSYDTISTALPSWRLAQSGNLDLTEYAGWSSWIVPVGDDWVSNRFPGAIAWGAPFYVALGREVPTILPASIAAMVATMVAVIVVRAVTAGLVGSQMATIGAMVLALGTGMWSVAADALWTHGPAAMFLAGAMLAASRNRHALVGLCLGGAVLCRPHLTVAGVIFIVAMRCYSRNSRWAVQGAGLLLGIAVLTLYNVYVFHSPSPLGGYDPAHVVASSAKLAALPQQIAGGLVSPARGLLVYSPVLVLMAASLHRAWKVGSPPWVKSAAWGAAAYAAAQLYLVRFTGGDRFYGARVLLESLVLIWPLLVISMAWTLARGAWLARAGLAISASASILLVGVGAAADQQSAAPIKPWTEFPPARALEELTFPRGVLVLVVSAMVAACVLLLSRKVAGDDNHARTPHNLSAWLVQRQDSTTHARPDAPSRAASSRSSSSSDSREAMSSTDRPSTT
jgi:alpha-1,2-mannosyltransferase